MLLCRLLSALVSGTEPARALSGWPASSPASRRAEGELGEACYAAGSPGVTPRHGAGIGGAAGNSLATAACFVQNLIAETHVSNTRQVQSWLFFPLLALNVLSW